MTPIEREYHAWRDVCSRLSQTACVTDSDLASPVTANDTPGQQLLQSLRTWGDSLAALKSTAMLEALTHALNWADGYARATGNVPPWDSEARAILRAIGG